MVKMYYPMFYMILEWIYNQIVVYILVFALTFLRVRENQSGATDYVTIWKCVIWDGF